MITIVFIIILLNQIDNTFRQQPIFLPEEQWYGTKDPSNNYFLFSVSSQQLTYDSSKRLLLNTTSNSRLLPGDFFIIGNDLIMGDESTIIYFPNFSDLNKFQTMITTTIFLSLFKSASSEIFIIGIVDCRIRFIKVNPNEQSFNNSYYEYNPNMSFNRLECKQKDSLLICAFSKSEASCPIYMMVFSYDDSKGIFTPVITHTLTDISASKIKYRVRVNVNADNKVLISSLFDNGVIGCELMQLSMTPTVTINKLLDFENNSCTQIPYNMILRENNDIIIVCATITHVIFHHYAYDNTLNKVNIKQSDKIESQLRSHHKALFIDELKPNLIVFMVWKTPTQSLLYYFHEPKCDVMNMIFIKGITHPFRFTKPEDIIDEEEFVVFKINPDGVYGNFYIKKNDSKVGISLDTKYPLSSTDFLFIPSSIALEEEGIIDYYLQTTYTAFDFSTTLCKFTVKIVDCFSTCDTCLILGDDINHQCITCISNYYKYMTDDPGNCYKNDETIPSSWYLHEGIFYDCSPLCNGCTGNQRYDSITEKYYTFCLQCSDDSFPYYSLPECRNEAVRETNLFFEPHVKVYYDCFENCATCSEIYNKTSMNCDTCIPLTSYDISTKNCLRTTIPTPAYKGEYDEYYPCFATCQSCSQKGNDSHHNCDSCLSSNYLMQSSNNCMFKDEIISSLSGYYIDIPKKIIYSCYDSCLECKGIGSISDHQCISCRNDYYQKVNTNNCYSLNDNTEGLYLITITSPFTWGECLPQCKTCLNGFTCSSCKSMTYFFINNCYNSCPSGTLIYLNECLVNCLTQSTQVLNECYDIFNPPTINNPYKTTDLPQDDLISLMKQNLPQFADGNIIKGNHYSVQVISKENSEYSHSTAIQAELITLSPDLCVSSLSNHYNISEDDIMIIKIDLNITKSPINNVKILYFDTNDNKQLNETGVCHDIDIPVFFPIKNRDMIDVMKMDNMFGQGYDSFNPTNDFFNDICTPYTTVNNLDTTIDIRRNDFFHNITLCQKGCQYEVMNISNWTATCKCKSLGDMSLNEVILEFNKNFLSTNINVIRCYQLVFSKELLYNIGFWILLSFIILKTILLVYILVKGFDDYSIKLSLSKSLTPGNDTKENNEEMTKEIKVSRFALKKKEDKIINKANPLSLCLPLPMEMYDNSLSIINKKSIEFKYTIKVPIDNIMIVIYSMIKRRHPILNTFFYPKQLDFQILKILIFFNTICINFSLNALFYTNAYINQRYKNDGAFDLIFSLPKSIFAYLIGVGIGIILSICILPHGNMNHLLKKQHMQTIQEKKESNQNIFQSQQSLQQLNQSVKPIQDPKSHLKIVKNINIQSINQAYNFNIIEIVRNALDREIKSIVKKIKIKVSIFIVINYILMIFFLYYVACFCAVNRNSQYDWLIGCGISFLISMTIPLVFALVFGIIKWVALKYKYETVYVINDIISLIN